MNPRHVMSAAALFLAAGIGAWLLLPDGGGEMVEADAPIPLPPVPPRIASGLEYERCLGLLTTEPESAEAVARAWVERGGGEPAVHCLALSRLALGEPVPAAEDLERLASASASPASIRAALLEQATQAWLMAGVASRARTTATSALALTPDDPTLLIERATAVLQLDRPGEAAVDLDRALSLDPRRADALVLRAAALRQTERVADALADAEAALRLDPDNAEALLERGILRQRRHDDAGARADWERAIELSPDSATADLARQNLALLEAGPSR
jgi:regulator of sirC expression with transglutaminase-like and TPR domain